MGQKQKCLVKLLLFNKTFAPKSWKVLLPILAKQKFPNIKQTPLPDLPAIKQLAKHFWFFEKQKLHKSKHLCLYNQNSELFCFLGQNCSKVLPWIYGKAKIKVSHPNFCFLGRNSKVLDSIFKKQRFPIVLLTYLKSKNSPKMPQRGTRKGLETQGPH